ncbi:hypothetical protein ACFOMD_17295 [Sphingoaurantiacus capsulatus]|uniref:Uncharacterized protein n=1 Tax=Sphingoaurantiacus capsulatus TaxID=1771310 RepID=A0ABV7XGD3_9SPHN
MISLPDRASIEGARDLALEPRLGALLNARIADLATPYGDLTDLTHFLVVEPGDTEAQIVEAVGFSPLVDPVDGVRSGDARFLPWWDLLRRHDGWFELVVCVGDSGFAFVLFIADADGVDRRLSDLCRTFAR